MGCFRSKLTTTPDDEIVKPESPKKKEQQESKESKEQQQQQQQHISLNVIPDHALAHILLYLNTFDALRAMETSTAMLSASLTRYYCHNLVLQFDLSEDSSDEDSSDSDSDSDSDTNPDSDSTLETKQQPDTSPSLPLTKNKRKKNIFEWEAALSFCKRRAGQIRTLRLLPPDGIGINVIQLARMVDTSQCQRMQIFNGPWIVVSTATTTLSSSSSSSSSPLPPVSDSDSDDEKVLVEKKLKEKSEVHLLVKEASRLEACQRSYDSEYFHEYSSDMSIDQAFLTEGGSIEEAETLLAHINSGVLSFLHCTARLGACSHPYGKLQGWINIRKRALENFLPVQKLFNHTILQFHSARACKVTRERVRALLCRFQKMKKNFNHFLVIVHGHPHRSQPNTEEMKKEYENDPTTSPCNMMREHVLLPMIDAMITDLARVYEFLDSIHETRRSSNSSTHRSCGSGVDSVYGGFEEEDEDEQIEHWMMLDDSDKAEMNKWTPSEMITVGQALDTLRTDPQKFKAFAEMTRHMSEMMKIDV